MARARPSLARMLRDMARHHRQTRYRIPLDALRARARDLAQVLTTSDLRRAADTEHLTEMARSVAAGSGLAPPDEMAELLAGAARAFWFVYTTTGDDTLLAEATVVAYLALGVGGDGVDRAAIHDQVALLEAESGRRTGTESGLRAAVGASRQAVALAPPGHPDLPLYRAHLAGHLLERYAFTGEPVLLIEAHTAAEQAAEATEDGHPHRVVALAALARMMADAGRALGYPLPLEGAVRLLVHAFELPGLEPEEERIVASELAAVLAEVHVRTSATRTFEYAATFADHVLDRSPRKDDTWARAACTHAALLTSHNDRIGEQWLVDWSLELARETIAVLPPGHTERPRALAVLAASLAQQLALTGDRAAGVEAVDRAREAVRCAPATAADRPRLLAELAAHLLALHRADDGDGDLLVEAAAVLDQAETSARTDAEPGHSLLVARVRADHAHLSRDGERALDALRRAEAMVATALDEADGKAFVIRDLLGLAPGLAADLAYEQAMAGDLEGAITTLETGRPWVVPSTAVDTAEGFPLPVLYVVPGSWGTLLLHGGPDRPVTARFTDLRSDQIVGRLRPFLRALDRWAGPVVGDMMPRLGVAEVDEVDAVNALAAGIEAAAALAAELLDGIEVGDRLLVVPVGVAAVLPWAAAPRPDGHLIDHTTVSVAPAVGLVTGHPPVSERWIFAACWGPDLDLEGDRALLERLGARLEDAPTATWVRDCLREAEVDIAHLSCHGTHVGDEPLSSALLLAPEGGHEPSRLTVAEVMGLRLRARVVNLSACSSGMIDLSRAEQAIGFAAAFLAGGAANVMATGWPVSSEMATRYNAALYGALARGAEPAVAHRTAVGDLREKTAIGPLRIRPAADQDDRPPVWLSIPPGHPFWWAAFTHHGLPTGDWSPRGESNP